MDNVVIMPESQIRQLFKEEIDSILKHRIPEIIRQANCKEFVTSAELEGLTGMSRRMQKYHRETGNLPYSQEGRKIFYRTTDVEKFMNDRRIEVREGVK